MTSDQYTTDLTFRVAHVRAQVLAKRLRQCDVRAAMTGDPDDAGEAACAYVALKEARRRELAAELQLCRLGAYQDG